MKVTGRIKEEGLGALASEVALREGVKVPRIWVVVADAGVARIFRKPNSHLELVGEMFPEETTQAGLTNDTVGRLVSSGGGGSVHHKYEPHMEAGRQDALQFARELADWLEIAVREDIFDRFVLVAAPRTLGELRAAMPKAVQGRIVAEVDKDLTNLDERALHKALNDVLWF